MQEDAANETVGIAGAEEPTDESGEEVGDPTFSSTPRNLSRQKSVSFLACSSRLLDDAPLANGFSFLYQSIPSLLVDDFSAHFFSAFSLVPSFTFFLIPSLTSFVFELYD